MKLICTCYFQGDLLKFWNILKCIKSPFYWFGNLKSFLSYLSKFNIDFHNTIPSINWQSIAKSLKCQFQDNVEVSLRPAVSRQVCLGVKPHLGPKTRFLLLAGNLMRGRVSHLSRSQSIVHVTYIYKSKSELLYDWRFTANRFVLASVPWGSRPVIFFQLNPCGHSPYVTSSLTRRWFCLLRICLAFRQVYVSHI
jgi:hypothetical protein